MSHSLVDKCNGTQLSALHWLLCDTREHSGEQDDAVFELMELSVSQEMQVSDKGLQERRWWQSKAWGAVGTHNTKESLPPKVTSKPRLTVRTQGGEHVGQAERELAGGSRQPGPFSAGSELGVGGPVAGTPKARRTGQGDEARGEYMSTCHDTSCLSEHAQDPGSLPRAGSHWDFTVGCVAFSAPPQLPGTVDGRRWEQMPRV